ncbi:hypothetical protein NHX12_022835, partial [Muraenolepis orangiensis]
MPGQQWYTTRQISCDVIHTVGPVARGRAGHSESSDLRSCYQNSLKLMVENNLTTV